MSALDPDYAKKYMLERYHRRRAQAAQMLGGRCVDCSAVDALEFARSPSATRSFTVAAQSYGQQRFEDAVANYLLLCTACRVVRSRLARGLSEQREHGTLLKYQAGGCRCSLCRAANAADAAARKRVERALRTTFAGYGADATPS